MKKQLLLSTKLGALLNFLILFCIFGFTNNKSIDLDTSLRIVIYEGKNFASYKSEVRRTIRNLKYVKKNNEVSSIIVDKGTVAKIYTSPHYEGCSFTIVGPYKVPRLDIFDCGCTGTWDNVISSIELYSNSSERSAGVYGIPASSARIYPYNTPSEIGYGNFRK